MKCQICCSNDTKTLFQTPTPYLDRKEKYLIKSRNNCLHWYALGNISIDYLSRIYNDQSFHSSSQQVSSFGDVTKNSPAPVELNAQRRVGFISKFKQNGKLMDIGAGNGYFVKHAQQSGFYAQGIELNKQAAQFAQEMGVDVIAKDFMDASIETNTYDVITLWDVISGFSSPSEVLERLSKMLKHDGILVMTIPRSDCWIAKLSKRFWPLVIPPVNINYFSRKSIYYLLQAHGLEIEYIGTQPKQVTLQFIFTKLFRTLSLHRFEKLCHKIPKSLSITLNLKDIYTIVARVKKSS